MPTLTRAATLVLLLLAVLTAQPALAYEPGVPLPGDLIMKLTASAPQVDAGSTVSYTMTITNPTVNVRVCDPGRRPQQCWWEQQGQNYTGVIAQQTLPSNVTFQSASLTAGSGFVCSFAAPTVTCSNGKVNKGATATINVTVVAPNQGTTLSSAANVSTAQWAEERSYTNNSSTLSTVVRPRPANVVFNPTTVDFGNVGTGYEVQRVVTMTNTGELPFAITSRDVTSTTPYPMWAEDGCGQSLAAGATCYFTVYFSPVMPGQINGNLLVNGAQRVFLTGVGVPPSSSLSTTSIHFSPREAGLMPAGDAIRPITLTNTGAGMLLISSIGASSNFGVSHNCPEALAAGAQCVLQARFAPQGPGNFNGGITITSNAHNSPQFVTMTGSGYIPNLQTTVSRSNAAAGQVVTFTIEVRNAGSTPASATNIAWLTGYAHGAWVKSSETSAPFNCTQAYSQDTQLPDLGWSCRLNAGQTLQPGATATLKVNVQLPTQTGRGFLSTINTITASGANLSYGLTSAVDW